ncbi:MAG: class B sortase [Mogibacterium sp.]|nr:class B sortase [Mogibacterium sp.]
MDKEERKTKSKTSVIRRTASDVIVVCLVCLVALSGFRIYTALKSYRADRSVYESVSEQASASGDSIDFEAFSSINPDVIGWLRYEGTAIDYPVVQGQDNEKYLGVLFDGTKGDSGTLFADCVTEDPFRQFNTIIYGHHMKDGSMFAGLKKLKDPDWTAGHPVIELFTPDGNYHLQVWAFLNQPSDSNIYTTNIKSEDSQRQYIELIEKLASYTTDVSVASGDSLAVLSTCAYEYQNARYIVVCKIVPWE